MGRSHVGIPWLRAISSSIYRSQGWSEKGLTESRASLEFDSSIPQGEKADLACLAIYGEGNVAGCEI